MGLGKAFVRQAATEHVRTIVSSGFSMGPSATLGAGESYGGSPLIAYRGALGISSVDRAVQLLSDLMGSLPWEAFTEHGRDYAEKISPTPILLDKPNPEEDRVASFSGWMTDLLMHGNAVGIIADRNAQGYATAILPVPTIYVGVRRANGSGSPIPTGPIEYRIGSRTFSPYDILHIKGPGPPGALRGYGVLEKHFNGYGALNLAEELARQAQNVSIDGVPTGVLRDLNPDATIDDLRNLKGLWVESQRDRTVAALNATTEFQPLAWDPEKLQLLDARKFSLLEVANIFGLPPRFVGAASGDSLTYATTESEAADLIKFSLGGHLARFEQALSNLLPRGTCVKANLDSLLRGDLAARYAAYKIGVDAGFLLRSEVRTMEDWAPVAGIDDNPVLPINVKVADKGLAPAEDTGVIDPAAVKAAALPTATSAATAKGAPRGAAA